MAGPELQRNITCNSNTNNHHNQQTNTELNSANRRLSSGNGQTTNEGETGTSGTGTVGGAAVSGITGRGDTSGGVTSGGIASGTIAGRGNGNGRNSSAGPSGGGITASGGNTCSTIGSGTIGPASGRGANSTNANGRNPIAGSDRGIAAGAGASAGAAAAAATTNKATTVTAGASGFRGGAVGGTASGLGGCGSGAGSNNTSTDTGRSNGGGSSMGTSGGNSSKRFGGGGASLSAGSSSVMGSIGSASTCRVGGNSGVGGLASSNISSEDALLAGNSQIEIVVDQVKRTDSQSLNDIEHGEADDGEDPETNRTRRVRHKNRPLLRRVVNYVRTAFQGVHFTSSNDSELEELENLPPRYRPDSLSALCRATRFSEAEIKRIYRGFKAECPTGVVKEDTFKVIYASFFPQGANTGLYAHYVFNTLDQHNSGIVSFEDFVQGLSVLSRGSLEEKLRWTFSLYDINRDGYITREEMTDIVTAIFELMARLPDTCPDESRIKEKVDKLFEKMDVNRDGVVTLDEFLECCRNDVAISRSIAVFDTTF